MKRPFLLSLFLVLTSIAPVAGQVVCLPLPRLLTTMPMGGAQGTQFELTISGENIEDPSELIFTHPGISATPLLDADGQKQLNKWTVSIADDCPRGVHEVRIMTRLGISSSRIFCVDALTELLQTDPNTTLQTAMALPINSVCNSVMTTRSVDYFTFDAVQGHRYVVNVASRGIDSKLDAVIIIGDAEGRDLVVDRSGGTLDFTAAESGPHTIKVHELTFKGGPAYYYRLSLQDVALDSPVPQFASARTVSSFSWPPAGLSELAATVEAEPNDGKGQIQKITLPCDISGSFFPAADVDTFEFHAAKGDVWWVEVASERLGRPTDPTVLVQHVTGTGESQTAKDVAEFTDITAPIRPSSNGYAYDGPPYNGGSPDLIGKLEIPEDGVYRLQLTDLFGGTRNDSRNIYRLIIRQASPDFAVAAWGLHMELRNGDRNALSKPIALRGGITMALEVAAVRRDGFDGDIDLVIEGLPEGVTAQGLKIPKGKTRGIMLLTVDQDAPRSLAHATFYGKSQWNGTDLIRPVQMAAHAWPIVDSWSEIPQPRLIEGMPISVTGSEVAPISIAAAEKKTYEVKAGDKLTIPLMLTKRTEFSGSILQLKTSGDGFENNPRFDVALAEDTVEAVLDTKALGTQPGEYLIAFYGSAVAKYRYNPQAIDAAEAEHTMAVQAAAAIGTELQQLTESSSDSAAAAVAPADAPNAAAPNAAVRESGQQESTTPDIPGMVAELTEKKRLADARVVSAAAKLKTATDAASPRDTVDIVLTEPIAIKVLAP